MKLIAGVRHQRTRAGMKPLDGPPNANGEDDEFKNWEETRVGA